MPTAVKDDNVELYGTARLFEATVEAPEERDKRIENLEDAARYAYGVSETRKEIEKINNVAAKEIAKWQEKIAEVEAWQSEVLKPLIEKLEYFNMLLTGFHVREFTNAPNEKARAKVKSIKLPYGVTLASREQPVKLEVTDDDALLAYATAIGQIDVPAPKPKWGEIKKGLTVNKSGKVVDLNGEVLPFVGAVPQDRKFEVK